MSPLGRQYPRTASVWALLAGHGRRRARRAQRTQRTRRTPRDAPRDEVARLGRAGAGVGEDAFRAAGVGVDEIGGKQDVLLERVDIDLPEGVLVGHGGRYLGQEQGAERAMGER